MGTFDLSWSLYLLQAQWIGSLIQVLLVDMSYLTYLTYLWSQCLSSESKYSGLVSFLVKNIAVSSAYTLASEITQISKTGPINFAVC